MPWFGAPSIEKLVAKRDVAGLLRVLHHHKEQDIGRNAVLALGQLGDVRAVAPLIAMLGEDIPIDLQAAIVQTLGKLRDERSLVVLLAAIEEPEHAIRNAAIVGLGEMGREEGIAPLLALLNRRDQAALAPSILEALARIGAALDASTRAARIAEPLGELLLDRPELHPLILKALDASGWTPDQDRVAAAYWMAKGDLQRCIAIGLPAVPALISALAHEHLDLRKAAFMGLVQLGAPAAPDLINAFLHPNTEIRKAAFHALLKIGPNVVPAALAALGHEQDEVRLALVRLLGQLGDPRAIVPLIGMFRDVDWTVRSEAYRAIVRIGQPAIEQLVAALSHESDEIRWGAAGTLEALGWKPGRDTLGAIYWIVKGDWHRCIEIGAAAVPPLIERLDHWDEMVRKHASGTLVQIGAAAVEPLIAALGPHHSSRLRTWAAITLGMIGDRRAEQPLRDILADRDKEVSQAASEAISAIQTGEIWRGSS